MINRNFNYEFFDLFNRLLFSLGISNSSRTRVKYYLNNKIKKLDDSYFVELNDDLINKYPYSLDDVNKNLRMINDKNFEFVNKDQNLSNLPHADIAEYFVNLKFCYLMKIPVYKCRKFINTRLTNKLYPISHAPGKMSDMNFFIDDKKLCSVETTIHDSIPQIINHEFYPSISHLLNHESKKINYLLILVQPFDSDEKLVNYFSDHGKLECGKNNKTFQLKTFNFKQLSDLINF